MSAQPSTPVSSPAVRRGPWAEATSLRAAVTSRVHLSEVLAALSHALDLTEGQPVGHSIRSCLIAMRIARELDLDAAPAVGAVLRDAAQGRRLLEQRGTHRDAVRRGRSAREAAHEDRGLAQALPPRRRDVPHVRAWPDR